MAFSWLYRRGGENFYLLIEFPEEPRGVLHEDFQGIWMFGSTLYGYIHDVHSDRGESVSKLLLGFA